MARQHVFPVCSPGSKTIAYKDKIEGGRSSSNFSGTWYETEDPNILFHQKANGEYGPQRVMLSEEKSEYLIDHTEAPDTDLTLGANIFYISEFPFQAPNAPLAPHLLWEEINGKLSESEVPPPGFVVCVGRKKNSDASWSNFEGANVYVFQGFQNPASNSPFGNYGSGFETARYQDGEWVTYMFTGTRFVILGSNNWF